MILDGAAVGTIFLFAYLVIYVIAPHLSGYSWLLWLREMMRAVEG